MSLSQTLNRLETGIYKASEILAAVCCETLLPFIAAFRVVTAIPYFCENCVLLGTAPKLQQVGFGFKAVPCIGNCRLVEQVSVKIIQRVCVDKRDRNAVNVVKERVKGTVKVRGAYLYKTVPLLIVHELATVRPEQNALFCNFTRQAFRLIIGGKLIQSFFIS